MLSRPQYCSRASACSGLPIRLRIPISGGTSVLVRTSFRRARYCRPTSTHIAHRDSSWINHEWLSEVIFAGVYGLSGPTGLVVLKTVLSLVLIGLVHGRLRRRGMGGFGCAFLLVLMSIPFRMGLGTIRPQIFTYLFFYGELVLLDKASSGRDRWLWVLPLMLAVWMNLHGGVLAGAGVLGIWIVVRLIAHPLDHSRSVERRLHAGLNLGLIAVASGGALLINPYGAELVAFLLRTATVARPEIREWVPLALAEPAGAALPGTALDRRRRNGREPSPSPP